MLTYKSAITVPVFTGETPGVAGHIFQFDPVCAKIDVQIAKDIPMVALRKFKIPSLVLTGNNRGQAIKTRFRMV